MFCTHLWLGLDLDKTMKEARFSSVPHPSHLFCLGSLALFRYLSCLTAVHQDYKHHVTETFSSVPLNAIKCLREKGSWKPNVPDLQLRKHILREVVKWPEGQRLGPGVRTPFTPPPPSRVHCQITRPTALAPGTMANWHQPDSNRKGTQAAQQAWDQGRGQVLTDMDHTKVKATLSDLLTGEFSSTHKSPCTCKQPSDGMSISCQLSF